MNELHLFAGGGGGILGGMLLGHRCVCAVEISEYCRRSLLQRQRDGILPWFPIWDDVCTFDGKPWRGIVQVVAGGFPCKGISVAGDGTGLDHAESGLWREQARIIGEVLPQIVFVENSPALTLRGGVRVISDLAALGYDCRWGVISAADAIWSFGTPCLDHLRERIWIFGEIANASSERSPQRMAGQGRRVDGQTRIADHQNSEGDRPKIGANLGRSKAEESSTPPNSHRLNDDGSGHDSIHVFARESPASDISAGEAHTESQGISERKPANKIDPKPTERDTRIIPLCSYEHPVGVGTRADTDRPGCEEQLRAVTGEPGCAECDSLWAVEPGVGRMAHGVAHRVDRLTAIGNGQVPAVVELAWKILK